MRSRSFLRAYFRFLLILAVGLPFGAHAQKSSKKTEATIEMADSLMEKEDFAGALAIYNKHLEKSKFETDQDFALLYKRAYGYYALKQYENALNDINKFIERNPNPQAKMLRAYINQELGNNDEQLKDLSEIIALDPDNLDLVRWRASVLMEAERYREARKDIQKLLIIDQSPEIKGYLGLSYYYDDKPDSALMVFDQIIARNPGHVQAYVYAASLGLEQETFGLALQYINKGLAIDKKNMTLLFYKGVALVQDEKITEGCRCLSKAFASGVDDAGDYLKGFCYGVD